MTQNVPLFIMLTTDEHEKVQMAAMTASVAAVSERNVEVFVSMNAIKIFRIKERAAKLKGGEFSSLMHEKNVPNPLELLEQGKMLGDLKVYACSMALDVSATELSDLTDIVDDTAGLTKFLSDAEQGQLLVF